MENKSSINLDKSPQNNQSEDDSIDAIYQHAIQLLQDGKTFNEVKAQLVTEGLSRENANIVVNAINEQVSNNNESDGGGFMMLVVVGLIIFNGLSYLLDWPLYIY